MRWVIVGKDDPRMTPGGLNRYAEGLVSGLREAGVAADWLVAGTAATAGATSLGSGPVALRIMQAFAAGLRCRLPTVLNLHFALYGAPFLLGALVQWRLQRLIGRGTEMPPRVIVNFHGPWAEESKVAGGAAGLAVSAKRGFERLCLRKADAVITLSRQFAEAAVEAGAPPNRVHVVPPGVGAEWFRTSASERTEQGAIQAVCVRRLTPRMGHLELLGALETFDFAVAGRPVRLHLVGQGAQEAAIRTWVEAHGRLDHVELHGRLADEPLRDLMEQCQVAVVPTVALEGFGLIVLEAMAMGIPVISTGQGGLREAMGPWAREPFLFDLGRPRTVQDSLRAATEAWDVPSERQQLQEFARRHQWSAVAETLRGLVK